jgi:hypothetical protein
MGRIITLSMVVLMTIGGGGVVLSSTSAEGAPVNISGPWIIDSQNGPSPICGFEQAGNNLTGSCIGPKAKGTITGTIIGEQVHWRWQWVTFTSNSAAAFDFVGTLRPDNTITGMVERREIGLSLNFTARKMAQRSENRPAQPQERSQTTATPATSSPEAEAKHGPGYVTCEVKWQETGRPAGYEKFMDNCLKQPPQSADDAKYEAMGLDPKLIRRANKLFPSVSQSDQRQGHRFHP